MGEPNRWRLDRRIPLAVIIVMALQVVAALMWATQLDARVVTLEHMNPDSRTIGETLARLEERLDAMRGDIGDLRSRLETLIRQKR